MAARKRKVQTVADEGYSKLEEYCIWLRASLFQSIKKKAWDLVS